MNSQPLVSVIIPNYNHARYLDQRIRTVIYQTYQNFEVIVLDDKSTDNSLDIIAKYKNDSHISQIVVNEENSGSTFKQWNKGIRLAKGEIIWIAESDDYCELNMLEVLVNAMIMRPDVVVAGCQYIYFNEECSWKGKEHKTRFYDGDKYVRYRMSRRNELPNASGIIFNKKAALKVSLEYLTFKSAGDYRFWCEILRYGKVAKVGKNLSYFRQSRISVTGNNIAKGITAIEDKSVYDYIDNADHLSLWQKKMARWVKNSFYGKINFASPSIRQRVFDIWSIKDTEKVSSYAGILFWFSGSLERHFGILI